jgi:hypothetical protein
MSTGQPPASPIAPQPAADTDLQPVAAPGEVSHIESAPAASESGARVEVGGREGPEPTRFGDWEKGGRCIDF